MNFNQKLISRIFGLLVALISVVSHGVAEKKQPGTVVLTFDDSVASHATFVAPSLKKHGFGAIFFITEGFEFAKDKKNYMTWEQIKKLHDDGFEIGNHTRRHISVGRQTEEQLHADVEYIEKQCEKHGIPKPISFCYPAYQPTKRAVRVLKARGLALGLLLGATNGISSIPEHWTDQLNAASDVDALIQISPAIKTLP